MIELTVEPGASTGMHSHGDHIIYFLAPGEALQKNPDGTEEKRSLPAGHIEWGGPVSHDTVNRGSVASRTLIIELK